MSDPADKSNGLALGVVCVVVIALNGFAGREDGAFPGSGPPAEAVSAPPPVESATIPVPSDPSATYRLLQSSTMPNGNVEAITRRDGRSGRSFARREIDCDAMTFRYLGEGGSREDAERDASNPGEMAELTPGSISTKTAQFVCATTR